jgi:hypothetical protein
MRSRHRVDDPMEETRAAAIARLEAGVTNLQGIVADLGEELRYLRRGIVNRLVWAIIVLALALGGKDVLQSVL